MKEFEASPIIMQSRVKSYREEEKVAINTEEAYSSSPRVNEPIVSRQSYSGESKQNMLPVPMNAQEDDLNTDSILISDKTNQKKDVSSA